MAPGLPVVALQEAGAPYVQLIPVMVSKQPDRRQPTCHSAVSSQCWTMVLVSTFRGPGLDRFEPTLHEDRNSSFETTTSCLRIHTRKVKQA